MKNFWNNLAAKLKTKSFWVTLLGALTLLISQLGWADTATAAEQITQAVGSILMLFGIVVSPVPTQTDDDDLPDADEDKNDDTKDE